MKPTVIISRRKDDQPFIAEVSELPGCIADGQTHAEALDNAHRIAAQWIETAQSLGRPIPTPRGRLKYA